MSLNDFHIKVGAVVGAAVGMATGNPVMIAEGFNNAAGMDWKTGAFALAGSILGGLGGSAYMSDRTAEMPLKPLENIGALTFPQNRFQLAKPFIGACLGAAFFTMGYLSEKPKDMPPAVPALRYETH